MRAARKLAAAAGALVLALGLSACDGSTGGSSTNDGPNGVIFIPVRGNPVGVPVFF
ncbi:hypothetical protein SEA_MISSDAISY_3 [Mycobacterium phage MissDaisy]|nr:hypothetical protein SEA_MISSDAISY_3 [Mycobacterium phage MissDaisy]